MIYFGLRGVGKGWARRAVPPPLDWGALPRILWEIPRNPVFVSGDCFLLVTAPQGFMSFVLFESSRQNSASALIGGVVCYCF